MSRSVKDLLKQKYGITRQIKRVEGYFKCSSRNLTSLEGSPRKVDEHFDCNNNLLTSLDGISAEIGLSVYIESNQLTSFKCVPELPRIINGDFDCSDNDFQSLEGFPIKIRDELNFSKQHHGKRSPSFVKSDIRKVCDVEHYIVI